MPMRQIQLAAQKPETLARIGGGGAGGLCSGALFAPWKRCGIAERPPLPSEGRAPRVRLIYGASGGKPRTCLLFFELTTAAINLRIPVNYRRRFAFPRRSPSSGASRSGWRSLLGCTECARIRHFPSASLRARRRQSSRVRDWFPTVSDSTATFNSTETPSLEINLVQSPGAARASSRAATVYNITAISFRLRSQCSLGSQSPEPGRVFRCD